MNEEAHLCVSWLKQSWILQRAKVRKSRRFLRTTYIQDVNAERGIFLHDRITPGGTLRSEHTRSEKTLEQPIKTLYRESDNGEVMKLQTLKELADPGGGGLDAQHAEASAKSFFFENGLLQEGDRDVVAWTEIRERRTNADMPFGEILDYLEQQDIILHREYNGKPVVNSSATIGVLPKEEEVTLIKISNWASTMEEHAFTIKPESSDGEAAEIADSLERKITALIEKESRGVATSADVIDIQEGYYQHEDKGLIPVLVCEAEINPGQSEPYSAVILVNPYGDEEELWFQGRRPSQHPAEPLLSSRSKI